MNVIETKINTNKKLKPIATYYHNLHDNEYNAYSEFINE
jgi:hypothetical protein